AIREADPNVVVNGRLVRSAAANFGDYINTADRPAEFFPVKGNWEAIPTTNESYGYSKFDSSHKPVSHFIRLLANAASRGGNLLMNIGPKGDGSFDDRDVRILNGIGKWMANNGESIYGTSATTLPLQSWGVSTLKKEKLYLHVFDWPRDGKLYVAGLSGKNIKAYLLNDRLHFLPVQVLNPQDVMITIPKTAPDTVNTVIVVEGNTIVENETRLITPNSTVNRLLAFDAIQEGNGFSFGDGKTDRYYVEGWKSKDQKLLWSFHILQPADYQLKIRYLAPKESAGGNYALTFYRNDNGKTQLENQHTYNVVTNNSGSEPVNLILDVVHLNADTYNLVINPNEIRNAELLKLLEIQLVNVPAGSVDLKKVIADAETQTHIMLQEIPKAKALKAGAQNGVTPGSQNNDLVSPRTLDSGQLKLVSSRDWTSGFFPGQLWFLYEFTGKPEWKSEAEKYTANIEREKTNGGTHDMGFKIYCSFGTGYRLTKNQHYRDVIIESAKTLSTRFNPVAGVIRSWDNRKEWKYPVIIDNMMNLELLFAATKLTGDSSFYKIAESHATTTMKNHFRSDYSSYHVLDYDTVTGKVVQKTTHQGYSAESAWARGQAWGLYGFTMCYRETGNKTFLLQAEHIAAFLLHHPRMPADFIPYYDFDAPGIPSEPRDASAAAIMASALYELSTYSKNANEYRKAANKIIENLTRYYRSPIGENRGFILLHSTGAKPANSEVDVPINYADYYYLEALERMKILNEGKKLFTRK
ncbi:MAG: alpha-L-fucosidase, partial [Flavisolibacter sp.]